MKSVPFEILKGKILTEINNNGDEIRFTDSEGNSYLMKHYQDCCEAVGIESIVGDLQSLIGHEITLAEESTQDGDTYSEMWTFYKLATNKEYVDIRWHGDSEYYSVSVSFEQEKKEE